MRPRRRFYRLLRCRCLSGIIYFLFPSFEYQIPSRYRMELSKCKSTQIYISQCIDHRVYLNVHTFVYAHLGTCINVLAYKLIYYVLVTVYLICMSNDADKKRRKKQRMSRPLKYAFNFGCQKSEWLHVLKFTFLRVYRVSTNASDLL